MRTMARECGRSSLTAVHAYEDCSLWQFVEAKRLGKACIYDMPIGYNPAWERIQTALVKKYADWLSPDGLSPQVRREQTCKEIELADLVLVPSSFVADTVRDFHPEKAVALAPYGADLAGWPAAPARMPRDAITFLFAGQCSVRKGVPLLLEAWRATDLQHARFSNRPFGVKRFQTIHHHCSIDVAHGLVLLFGIGTKALVWDLFSQEV